MTTAKRTALAAMILVLGFVMLVGACFVIAAKQVADSNARWCATLSLLTSKPVAKPANPKANPTQAGQYALYENLTRLRNDFHCHL